MECQDRGYWHFGMSSEACHNGGGQFYPTRCIILQRCIDDRPLEGEDGFRQVFEDWVEENEVHIYDAGDKEQCEDARTALDFDRDHIDDQEIWYSVFGQLLLHSSPPSNIITSSSQNIFFLLSRYALVIIFVRGFVMSFTMICSSLLMKLVLQKSFSNSCMNPLSTLKMVSVVRVFYSVVIVC